MRDHARRASRTRMQARSRARYLAERIGRSVLDARTGSGMRQREVAERAGISQSFYSRIELGHGSRASLETLVACALACDAQLAAFLEALPGASLPRDIGHVRRQQAVIALAAAQDCGRHDAGYGTGAPTSSAEWPPNSSGSR